MLGHTSMSWQQISSMHVVCFLDGLYSSSYSYSSTYLLYGFKILLQDISCFKIRFLFWSSIWFWVLFSCFLLLSIVYIQKGKKGHGSPQYSILSKAQLDSFFSPISSNPFYAIYLHSRLGELLVIVFWPTCCQYVLRLSNSENSICSLNSLDISTCIFFYFTYILSNIYADSVGKVSTFSFMSLIFNMWVWHFPRQLVLLYAIVF